MKYLFKYCLKGPDHATVEIRGRRKSKVAMKDDPVDEIQQYFDGRYICGAEAAYRTFGFEIHHRTISVERLPFHLPGDKIVVFRANDHLPRVVRREENRRSKLEAFFHLNHVDSNARQYTYDEIPQFYVWNDVDRLWSLRKKGSQIGRLTYAHHSKGEVWYLRMLLSKVRGPQSFEELRFVKGIQYDSFSEACNAYGFLNNDNEWHEVIEEAAKCGFAPQIRELFVHIIVNCQVTDLKNLWDTHFIHFSDDILYKRRIMTSNPELNMCEDEIKFYALAG